MNNISLHHVGIWVEDADEMIDFLTKTMGFRLLTRNPRGAVGAGERILIQSGDKMIIEVLTEPDVEPRPDFEVHPVGHVAGIPHLCFSVADLPAWQEKLKSLGYSVLKQVPDEGFMESELGRLRVLFFEGPGGVGFELFEFEEEYNL